MACIAYVDRLNEMYQSQGFPSYRWSIFDTSPWTPFEKSLEQSCIALVSSAGISMEDQEPFDPWAVNGLSFRQIPKDAPVSSLKLHHNYFDHRDAIKDINCVFPIERLQEMESSGYIRQMAPTAITLGMGRLYKRTALQTETVPKMLEILKEQGVDAALLVAA
jgi:D-proline reductase (dithiol) PrdB